MNKVFVSGVIADRPVFEQGENGTAHLVFALCVRHRTQKGEVKREMYAINAWNKAAEWGRNVLEQGRSLAVQGYLTQRLAKAANVILVEVTAEEFFLGAEQPARQTKRLEGAASASREAAIASERPSAADAPARELAQYGKGGSSLGRNGFEAAGKGGNGPLRKGSCSRVGRPG